MKGDKMEMHEKEGQTHTQDLRMSSPFDPIDPSSISLSRMSLKREKCECLSVSLLFFSVYPFLF